MAQSFADALDGLIALCQQQFETVQIVRHDIYPDYAVLWLEISYRDYLLRIKEVRRPDTSRKYAYYIFQGSLVIRGFDNAPDPRALQQKYGQAYTQHRLESIPHVHGKGKLSLELTPEMACADFIQWVKHNL